MQTCVLLQHWIKHTFIVSSSLSLPRNFATFYIWSIAIEAARNNFQDDKSYFHNLFNQIWYTNPTIKDLNDVSKEIGYVEQKFIISNRELRKALLFLILDRQRMVEIVELMNDRGDITGEDLLIAILTHPLYLFEFSITDPEWVLEGRSKTWIESYKTEISSFANRFDFGPFLV